MNIVDGSMVIAMEYHAGDRNKHDGELYLLHVARVFMNVKTMGGTNVQQAVAWLHDAVEDTSLTLARLSTLLTMSTGSERLLVNNVVQAVDAITKRKGETLEDYYARVKMNDDARFVKFHGDMKDNFRRNHAIVDEATRARMAKKYSLGMDVLG